jgi:hypothetical protein
MSTPKSWVTGSFEQGCGTGAKEQIVKQPLVLEDERGELVVQGEDDMEVRHRQQLGGTRGQRSGTRVGLAPGAVPVAARNGSLSITCLMGSLS